MAKIVGLLLVGFMAIVTIGSTPWHRIEKRAYDDLNRVAPSRNRSRTDEGPDYKRAYDDLNRVAPSRNRSRTDEGPDFRRSVDSEAAIEAEFRTHDKNNDGHLSYQELKATIPRDSGLTESQIRRTFNYLDTDNSNTLDLAEIKRMYEIVQG